MLVPDELVFRHEAFWANHFGGVYVFLDEKTTTVICDPSVPGFRRSRPWQVSYMAITDHARIYDFLATTNRLQLPQASWVQESGLFQHRADMVIRGLVDAADPNADLMNVDRIWLQAWILRNAALVARDGIYPSFRKWRGRSLRRARSGCRTSPRRTGSCSSGPPRSIRINGSSTA